MKNSRCDITALRQAAFTRNIFVLMPAFSRRISSVRRMRYFPKSMILSKTGFLMKIFLPRFWKYTTPLQLSTTARTLSETGISTDFPTMKSQHPSNIGKKFKKSLPGEYRLLLSNINSILFTRFREVTENDRKNLQ